MKGFKNSSKIKSGFHFPSSAGFSDSSGRMQTVRSYSRRVVRKAEGGMVDSPVIKRTEPMTEFDREYGGTGPLRPGFKKGGKIGALKSSLTAKKAKDIAQKVVSKHVATPAPKGHKGLSFRRAPLIGD